MLEPLSFIKQCLHSGTVCYIFSSCRLIYYLLMYFVLWDICGRSRTGEIQLHNMLAQCCLCGKVQMIKVSGKCLPPPKKNTEKLHCYIMTRLNLNSWYQQLNRHRCCFTVQLPMNSLAILPEQKAKKTKQIVQNSYCLMNKIEINRIKVTKIMITFSSHCQCVLSNNHY